MTRRHSMLGATVAAFLLALAACDNARSATETAENETANQAQPAQAQEAPAAQQAAELSVDPGAEDAMPVKNAVATLRPTKGNDVRGTVQFEQTGSKTLQVRADVSGLPPGKHGYHVHLYGDCSGDDAKTAGTHFNFDGSSQQPGDVQRITGNLGELDADANGHAQAQHTVQGATLQGAYSIIGRSVVVHEKGNDPSQPPIGAAGARLACGTIGVGQPAEGEKHAQLSGR